MKERKLKKYNVLIIISLCISMSFISGVSESLKDENHQKTNDSSNKLVSFISKTLPEIPKNINESREIIKEYFDLNSENTTVYGFTTFGPRAFTVSKITYQNGTFLKNSYFRLNLMLTIMIRLGLIMYPLLRPIIFFVFDDKKIDFTVEYKRDTSLGFFSRRGYFTFIDEMVNGNSTNNTIQIWNEKHTVNVEGFFGVCMLYKRSLPVAPSFFIIGICDNVTLIQ